MVKQTSDILSVAATLPTGKNKFPAGVKYMRNNLAIQIICVNTHTHTFARHIISQILRALIYTFLPILAREEASFSGLAHEI